jgi:hypothetical protein
MPDFTPHLKKLLKAQGCYWVRQGKGDHEIWYSPLTDRHFVVDGKIKSKHTAMQPCNKRDFRSIFSSLYEITI